LLTLLAAAAASLPAPANPQALPAGVTRTVLVSLEPGEEIKKEGKQRSPFRRWPKTLPHLDQGQVGRKDPSPFSATGSAPAPFTDFKAAMAAAYKGRKDSGGASRDCALYKPPARSPEARAFENKEPGPAGESPHFPGPDLRPLSEWSFQPASGPTGLSAITRPRTRTRPGSAAATAARFPSAAFPANSSSARTGKSAAVYVEGSMDMTEMEGLAKLPPDKQMEAFKTMDQRFLYTLDGAKYGPF